MAFKKIFGFALALIAVLVFTMNVSAIALPPVVSISASPNPARTISTITAVAVDLSGTGIAWVKIYEDGNVIKECSTTTCVHVAVHTSLGARTYYAVAADRQGRTNQSQTISVEFLNNAPILNAIGNRVVDEGSLLEFTISGGDIDGDPVTFSASNLPSGATFDANTRTFSWSPNYTQAGLYDVTFSISDGNSADSETITITVNDITAFYSNILVDPASPATYAPGQTYTFSSQWTAAAGIASVTLQFNGVNYPATFNGTDYVVTFNDLGAGNYTYQWNVVDGNGVSTSAPAMTYELNKAVPSLSITMLPASNVINGTETNVSGAGCPSQLTCILHRNNSIVSNPDVAVLPLGYYVYVYNTTGNENYTSASITRGLRVSLTLGDDEEDDESTIHELTDSEFANGHTETIREGDKIKFTFCGAPYYLKLSEIDGKKAHFSLTPGGFTFTLKEGESEEIDLDMDKVADIKIKLNDLTSSQAKVYVKRLTNTCLSQKPINDGGTLIYGAARGKLPAKKKASFWETEFGLLILLLLIFALLLAILYLTLKRMNDRNRKVMRAKPINGVRPNKPMVPAASLKNPAKKPIKPVKK